MSNYQASADGKDAQSVSMASRASANADAHISGVYDVECWSPRDGCHALCDILLERAAIAESVGQLQEARDLTRQAHEYMYLKWADTAKNLVTTVGANLLLDTLLAGSAYTTVGPFMGLINTNASAAAIGDTMGTHAGWLEVGATNAPQYTAPRKTISFSAAAAKSKASTGSYTFAIITTGGVVGGCFLVTGTGALSTIDNAAGVLYSAGVFTGGSKTVAVSDSLTVTYTATA